jgi:hypothetical protein
LSPRNRLAKNFFSLLRETSIGTPPSGPSHTFSTTFLFAAVRDIDRNDLTMAQDKGKSRFLFAAARDIDRNGNKIMAGGVSAFLFAAARDIDRNKLLMGDAGLKFRFYSLLRETSIGTNGMYSHIASEALFLFAAARDIDRNSLRYPATSQKAFEFLFAAARDIDRNPTSSGGALTSTNARQLHILCHRGRLEVSRRHPAGPFALVQGLHTPT